MAGTRRKGWLRRLRLPVLLLLVLAALIALLPQLLRPRVEQAASATLHTPVAIGWLGVDLVGRSVGIRKVALGEDAALTIARISARPNLGALLDGKIVLERIEIDGLRGTAEQDAKGLPILRGLPYPESGASSTGPPLVVKEVALSDVDIAAIPPPALRKRPVAVHLDELLLRQVPTADAGSAYQGELSGSLDGVPITAHARADQGAAGTRIAAEADLKGSPVSSDQFVLPPGFESLSATADGKVAYVLDPEHQRDQLTVDLTLADLKVAGAEQTTLAAKSVSVAGLVIDLSQSTIDLGRVSLGAPRIEAAMTAQGLVYPGLVPALVESGVAAPAPEKPPRTWRVTGGRIEADDGSIALRRDDQQVRLDLPSFSWRDIASGKSGALRMALRAPEGGAIDVSGRLGIDPPDLDAAISLTGLALPVISTFVDLPLKLKSGSASGSIEISGNPAQPRVDATLDVSQLHTEPADADADRILAVDRMQVSVRVEPDATSPIAITSLTLSYPYVMVQRSAAGIFPLDALEGRSASGSSSATSSTPSTGSGAAQVSGRTVRIDALTISNGRIDFVDQTTQPPYWMGVASAEAMVRGGTVRPAALDQLDFSARQDELHPVRASAQRTGVERWQAKATLDGLSLATLNPYLSPVLGYEAQTGSLTVDIDATLDGRTLQASSALSLDDVGLRQTGLDVIQRQTGIPLTVALSLLKDVGGEVELTIPVEVDTATGKYELGSFVTQAIGRAVLGTLSSPLRWLGMLFGTDGPPHALAIDPIPFQAGSAALDDTGTTRMTQVARILAAHADVDVVLKAQIALEDERAVGSAALTDLARRRAETVVNAFTGSRYGAPILPGRLVIAPWSPPADGKLDPAPAVYVELRSH